MVAPAVWVIIGAGILAYFIVYFLIGYLEKPKHPRTAAIINILGGVLLIGILAGCYIYFFVISPTFVEKPYITKPYLYVENPSTKERVINKDHIRWLVNEMGGYKLHDDHLSRTSSQFEFKLTDFSEVYSVRVNEHDIVVWVGPTSSPDGRIYSNQETIIRLFQSSNLKDDLVKAVKEKRITAEILADETTLALKGYKALYDRFK